MTDVINWKFKFGIFKTKYSNQYVKYKIKIFKNKYFFFFFLIWNLTTKFGDVKSNLTSLIRMLNDISFVAYPLNLIHELFRDIGTIIWRLGWK